MAMSRGGGSRRLGKKKATLTCASCFPVPFPGVKQEQLSPRSQASQPESLVMQPAPEGSVLRGEHAAVPWCGREGDAPLPHCLWLPWGFWGDFWVSLFSSPVAVQGKINTKVLLLHDLSNSGL